MKKILLFLVLAVVTMTAYAQSWNFRTVSDADVELLNAAPTNWTHDTANGNNRYNLATSLTASPLLANGTELAYAQGMLFTSAADKLRVDVKGMRMWLDSSARIIIPNVPEGLRLTVIAKSSAGSSTAADKRARGISVSANVTPQSGYFNQTSADQVTNVGIVSQTGDVELSCLVGAMYIYEIILEEADGDDEGTADDTPTIPALHDYSTSANAMKNQLLVSTLQSGTRYYNTADIDYIDINDDKVTVKQTAGTYTFDGNVTDIRFQKASTDGAGTIDNTDAQKVAITEARGWFESAYVKFTPFDGAKTYNVYIKGGKYSSYTRIDEQLVRNYGTYGRADVLGLVSANDYMIKVVPVNEAGQEMTANANEASAIKVAAYDRSGFAHKDRTAGIGAYNNDGSLKANALVVYVTKQNAKTVSLSLASNDKGAKTTYTGLQQIIYGYQKGDANGSYEKRPLDIRIIGCISAADCDEFLSSAEGIQIKGSKAYQEMNMTIEGVGDDATTYGFGFLLRSVSSVELRNFANMLCMDDAVSIDSDNSHIWVHHLDLFYGKPGSDADQVKGDGTLDLKGDSRYITLYANHLWDNGKASLCGMKSETGPNWITYHHNWFDHTDSRHPRIRTMSVHVYNNYYDGNSKYGVGAAFQSNAFVEANYFRNCKYPMLISMQGSDVATNPKGTFSGEDGGMIKSYANLMVGANSYVTYQKNHTEFDAYEASTRDEKVPADIKAQKGYRVYDNFDTDAALFYDYTPDNAADVPAIVTGWLGAGRMGHGDLQWQFDNATEDKNDKIIEGLKNALNGYRTSLIGIYGDATSTPSEQGQSPEEGGNNQGGNDNTGGSTETPSLSGSVVCTFNENISNSAFVSSTSQYGDAKDVVYNGVTYKKGLKIQSATTIKFTPAEDMKITLILSKAKDNTIKINGTEYKQDTVDASVKYYTIMPDIVLPAGQECTLSRGTAEANIVLIILTPADAN